MVLVSMAFSHASLICAKAGSIQIDDLRCEYINDPLGIGSPSPRLSWELKSTDRGQTQSAYEILVASSTDKLADDQGDLWDSGKVVSERSVQVPYAGANLHSGQRAFWKVRIWNQSGLESRFSPVATWEMGLLAPEDWRPAQWIARNEEKIDPLAPMLRRVFAVKKAVKQARVYVCGLGYYELHLNGSKLGDHLLDPAYTDYDRRVLYATYDVTAQLRSGQNALGVILGNGWYNMQTDVGWGFQNASWRNSPRVLLKLEIEFADGSRTDLVSDDSWQCSTGPIVYDNIYGGETYDARLEKLGWDQAGYDASQWKMTMIVSAPKGRLVAQAMPAIKAFDTLKPVALAEPKPGVWIFDFGQNLAGFAELRSSGPAGTKVVLKYGERVGTNGLLDVKDISEYHTLIGPGQQFQTDTYIIKGQGKERWHSRFDYHGFQYVEVTGFSGQPDLDSLRAVFIHSAVPEAGRFVCSNPVLNKIQHATRWSYLSNLQGYPTDCPQREKSGWTGDAHLAAEQAMYNFMPAAVYEKWLNDMSDLQWTNGELPAVVPTPGFGYDWGNGPAWDSAFLLIPEYLHEYYGDTRVLAEHYAGMKLYVDYLTGHATNGIVSIGLGDWVPVKTDTPVPVTSTAYYFKDAQIVSQTAALLGHTADAEKYAALAARIKSDFNREFYHAETGSYANGSQTALSCALYQGLVTPENRSLVLSNLVATVAETGGHIDTGILGAKYILNALLENGRADVAYRIVSQTNYPGWGWWMEQGATTLWEGWNGGGSRNHIMFGDVSAWFYKALAGINSDPAAPGFKHIIIRPNCVGNLSYVRATYDSIHGPIVSDWKLDRGKFNLHVEIPANTTATVYVPHAKVNEVREGSKLATKAPGIVAYRQEPDAAVFEIGSGSYQFSSPLAGKPNDLAADPAAN
jgi:alpha-L-rhamnosidase